MVAGTLIADQPFLLGVHERDSARRAGPVSHVDPGHHRKESIAPEPHRVGFRRT
jgi:hypothetical protein